MISDNNIGHINKIKLRRARLVLESMRRVYHSGIYPGPLSLAIPSRVGAMCTGDSFGHHWRRNSKFCIAEGPINIPVFIQATQAYSA